MYDIASTYKRLSEKSSVSPAKRGLRARGRRPVSLCPGAEIRLRAGLISRGCSGGPSRSLRIPRRHVPKAPSPLRSPLTIIHSVSARSVVVLDGFYIAGYVL